MLLATPSPGSRPGRDMTRPPAATTAWPADSVRPASPRSPAPASPVSDPRRGHLAPARLRLLPARGHRPGGHREPDERAGRQGVVQRPRPRRVRRPAGLIPVSGARRSRHAPTAAATPAPSNARSPSRTPTRLAPALPGPPPCVSPPTSITTAAGWPSWPRTARFTLPGVTPLSHVIAEAGGRPDSSRRTRRSAASSRQVRGTGARVAAFDAPRGEPPRAAGAPRPHRSSGRWAVSGSRR